LKESEEDEYAEIPEEVLDEKDLEALNPNASGRDIDTITEIAKESAYTVGREVLMMIDYDFALGKYSQRVNIALSKKSTE